MEISKIIYSIIFLMIVYYAQKLLKIVRFFLRLRKKDIFNEDIDLKQRFSLSKLPPKIDVIVLGAGCSGLSTASVLSKQGKKVIVLEQAGKAGGGLHSFTKEGFEFDAGFHYIGDIQQVDIVFNLLGSDKIEFNSFKNFDRIMNYNEIFDFVAPQSEFFQNLVKKFPDQEKKIFQYKKLLQQSEQLMACLVVIRLLVPNFLESLCIYLVKTKFSNLYKKSVDDILKSLDIQRDQQLYAVINGIYGDIGAMPDQFPFVLHAGLMGHYIKDGSLYPKKGVKHVVKSIVNQICANGGQVLTKAKVTQICVQKNQVYGVLLEGGQMIRASTVVSTIGLQNTREALPGKYKFPIDNLQYDGAFTLLTVFLGIDGLDKNIFPTHNIWYHPIGGPEKNYDIFQSRQEFIEKDNLDKIFIFMSFASSKLDPNATKHSVQLICEAKMDEFLPYKINSSILNNLLKHIVQRKEGYLEVKEKYQNKILAKFLEIFPEAKDKIKYICTGTPLSNERFLGRYGTYGPQMNIDRVFDLNHMYNFEKNVKGLYVAGQDVGFPSIFGNLAQGILVGLKVLKYI